MGRVFEDWSEDQTLKAAAVLAVAACALSTALGAAAEGFAERRLAAAGLITITAAERPPPNRIDYATTGSIAGENKRALVVLGPCGAR